MTRTRRQKCATTRGGVASSGLATADLASSEVGSTGLASTGVAGPGSNEDGDTGHVMVLLIGYVLLALLLITVVAAAGSLYLGHKKLLSMADGAALAAADTFELSGGSADSVPGTLLTDQGVLAAAQSYLSGVETPAGLGGITLDPSTGSGDGRTAQVGMTAVVHPMFINFLVPEGITISVTSTARANLVL